MRLCFEPLNPLNGNGKCIALFNVQISFFPESAFLCVKSAIIAVVIEGRCKLLRKYNEYVCTKC
jgi:hypothetical protein